MRNRQAYRHRKISRSPRELILICLVFTSSAGLLLFFALGVFPLAKLPDTDPSALKFPLWWAAPFYSASGYGVEAVSYVLGLLQYSLIRPEDLWLTHSGDVINIFANSQEIASLLDKQDYKRQLKGLSPHDLDRSTIAICHSFPDFWLRPNESYPKDIPGAPCPTTEMMRSSIYRIGRTMFETDRLPKHLVDHILEFDEIWVPSEFNRQSFAASGIDIKTIQLLPESINLTLFDPASHKALSIHDVNGRQVTGHADPETSTDQHLDDDDIYSQLQVSKVLPKPTENIGVNSSFIFLSIFKWEARKGWEILLKAFLEEFKAEERVELHIATHSFMENVFDWPEKVRQGIRDRCQLKPTTENLDFDAMPKILITDQYIDDTVYPRLYKGADALVVPTRGEGWGRPQMEAMAMGLPVISTNWSGLTAFLNEHTGYPIKIDGLVEAKPDGPNFFGYFEGSKWAQPSVKHLRQLMRHVFEHREEAQAKGAAARRYLEEHFSPKVVALGLQKLILGAQKRAEAKGRRQSATKRKTEGSNELKDAPPLVKRIDREHRLTFRSMFGKAD